MSLAMVLILAMCMSQDKPPYKGRIVGDFGPTDSKNIITLVDELPADVPAIQEHCNIGIRGCDPNRWTCADKTRVLLTSEDGKKWCHLLETK